MKNDLMFSIYKISKEKVIEINDGIDNKTSADDMVDILIHNMISAIRRNGDSCEYKVYNDYNCILVTTQRNPEWSNFIGEIFEYTQPETNERIKNSSNSFLMLKVVNNDIYAIVGGRGSYYLKRIIEGNFGRDLIPKISFENDSIIKTLKEDRISGNDLVTTSIKKNTSTAYQEIDSSSIPKDLNIYASSTMVELFGIEIDEGKKTSIDASDYIKIHKRLNIEELSDLLTQINAIEQMEDNYQLGYLIPIKKYNIRKGFVDDELYTQFINNYNVVEIIPDDMQRYLTDSTKYQLRYKDDLKEYDNPITIKDVYEYIVEVSSNNITKSKLKKYFKEIRLISTDEKLKPIVDKNIYEVIRGCIEYETYNAYIINGNWLVYDKNKYELIKEEYQKLYDINIKTLKETNIVEKFGLLKPKCNNETAYNESFKNEINILVEHPKTLNNVEIGDLFFWDQNRMYIMCNKDYSDITGVRDLLGQIETSSSVIRGMLDNKDGDKLLERLYDVFPAEQKLKLSCEEFITNIKEKRITYIAGFSNSFKRNTRSVYCQSQIKQLSRKLYENEFDFIVLNYKEETK